MIENSRLCRLFPSYVVTCSGDPTCLNTRGYREEEAAVIHAVPKRKSEFRAGRNCARQALARLGFPASPIPMGQDRAPIWPEGAVGSISHTRDYCAVALAKATDAAGLGLDVEIIADVGQNLWAEVCTPEELQWILRSSPSKRQPCAAVLFSAKECFYKCQYGITGCWLGFHDVRVILSPEDSGTFTVRVLKAVDEWPLDHTCASGQYALEAGHVLTGMVLPHS